MKTALTVMALMSALQATAQTAGSDDIAALKSQLKALQDRITQIEAERAAEAQKRQAEAAAPPPAAAPAPLPPNVVTTGDIPNSFKLPGTNTSVSIGGFVKGTAIRSSRSGLLPSPALTAELADVSLVPPTIPLSTAPPANLRTNNWKLSAQESRLIVRTSTPTAIGPFTTLIEGDFFGYVGNETATNGHGFRLRHAWATLGNFSAGQFWSNLVNLTASPETIDFSPPLGAFGGIRQASVRYTQNFDGGFWSASIENPESVIAIDSANTGGSTTPDNDKLPDFTAKVHFKFGSGEYELAGDLRRANSAQPAAYAKTGGGLGFSGAIPLFGTDRVVFDVGYGRNNGHMLGIVADGVVLNGDLQGISETSGFVGYRHKWTSSLRSNIDYSWIIASNPEGISVGTRGGLNRKFWSSHVNLIWNVMTNADIGVEYIRAMRQVESGINGDLSRVEFMGKFYF